MSDCLKTELGDIKKKGFGIIPKLIMQDEELSIEAKAIYSYMASYAGAGDTAFPGVEKMIRDLAISEKRFYNHRKQLVEQGYITITKTRDGNRRSNNIYTLNQIVKSEHSRFEGVQNEHLLDEHVQNVGTNNNSLLKSTVLKNNNIKK